MLELKDNIHIMLVNYHAIVLLHEKSKTCYYAKIIQEALRGINVAVIANIITCYYLGIK